MEQEIKFNLEWSLLTPSTKYGQWYERNTDYKNPAIDLQI